MGDRTLWYLVLQNVDAHMLVRIVPLVCSEWRLLTSRVASRVPLVAPETLFRHLHVLLDKHTEQQLMARLVWVRRLSGTVKDASLVQLAFELAKTRDSRVLDVQVLICTDAFEGNPRRSYKRTCMRRVSSPWFSLVSWNEKNVLGSSPPEMFAYFRLTCVSGMIVADDSKYSFSGPRFTHLDCEALARECQLESADAFRVLVGACIAPVLRDVLVP